MQRVGSGALAADTRRKVSRDSTTSDRETRCLGVELLHIGHGSERSCKAHAVRAAESLRVLARLRPNRVRSERGAASRRQTRERLARPRTRPKPRPRGPERRSSTAAPIDPPCKRTGPPRLEADLESSFEQIPDNTQLSVSAWATRRQWGVNRTSRVTETRPSGTEFWRRSRPTPVSDPHAETTGSIKISCACEWLIEALNLASHQRMHPATPLR